MTIGSLIAGATVALMVAATPVSTFQVAQADAGTSSSAVTSTARLAPQLPWTVGFDYGLLQLPAASTEAEQREAFTPTTTRSLRGSDAEPLDFARTNEQQALASETSEWDMRLVARSFAPSYWSPSWSSSSTARSSSMPRTQATAPIAASGFSALIGGSRQTGGAGALFASLQEWDGVQDGSGVTYPDTSFSLAARSPKEPALASRVETSATVSNGSSTNVPTPGTLALFALGIAAVIAGARGITPSPGRLVRY